MVLETLLKELDIEFKEIEYDDNSSIYKLNSKVNLVCMKSKSSAFAIERDLYYYLDNQKIEYHFLLINKNDNKYFLLPFIKFSNWLKGSFDSCDKDEIFFGKVVLQNEINEKHLATSLLKISK